MAFYANDVHPIPPDHGGADCDDQLPLISRVGRGIAGDDARVRLAEPDTDCETHIEGGYIDNKDGTWHSEWISENVNGGKLMYQYNLRPYTVPRTFTITFIYRRPGRPEWSWTTPAIPYIWTIDQDGNKPGDDPDHIVGSGVSTIFIRAGLDKPWREYLEYPEGTTRDDFNAPNQGEAWTSNITFGVGGDIELPNLDDLSKVLGISVNDIKNIIRNHPGTFPGIGSAKDLVSYIDHIYADLGFPGVTDGRHEDDSDTWGGQPTIKAYIDKKIETEINKAVTNIDAKIDNLYTMLLSIAQHIYGVQIKNATAAEQVKYPGLKKITWPTMATDRPAKIPTGNINILSPNRSLAILTHEEDKTGDDQSK